MTVRTRFAPSPTGSMHIGNVRNAAFSWLLARHSDGEFVLRVEDTDRARYVPGAVEEIIEGLRWLGTDWDEGPIYQSSRLNLYQNYCEELLAKGRAYRCWCSPERLDAMRKEQQASGQPTGYDRWCRGNSHGRTLDEAHVIRFAMPLDGTTAFTDEVRGEFSFDNALQDDFVMLKADGYPTYHLASVVDDHLMRITHVVRSEEWISSTPKHLQLYMALGWKPPALVHPPLILGPDRSKLSKRHGAVAFKDYIEHGYLPDAVLNFMALLGWSPGDNREVMSREELTQAFSIEGIVKHPAIFDIQKLDWINQQHTNRLSNEDYEAEVRRHIRLRENHADRLPDSEREEELKRLKTFETMFDDADPDYRGEVIALMQSRSTPVADFIDYSWNYFAADFDYEEKGLKWLREESAPEFLGKLADALDSMDWGLPEKEQLQARLEQEVRSLGAIAGRDGGAVIHPVRIASTGRAVGPSLFEALAVLGKARVSERLRRAQQKSRELIAS